MTRIDIVKRGSKEPVGVIEVDQEGLIRFIEGPPDLQDVVQTHLDEGLWAVRSFITEAGDQIAEPYLMTPSQDQERFEGHLSSLLRHLGYCTLGMAEVLEGPVTTA